ncbi:beta-galactosidase [Clostridium cellulovorans]|uniref:Beta-galactosidase n=2 Tax=Clostridium cellulovorans TaxID=1493 RepID=D9SQL3_CLOC7|nr:beta-galactosidase [Clostridium cellulovorans]ADL52219.1 Beta-galactosidase [Clostridium cellulovorans 743B]
MVKKYAPINKNFPHFYHGGDYNPDQWLKYPGVFEEDIRLMKLSNCNVMSIGIFSWTALEPEEGNFNFGWMDNVIDKLYENGIYVVLATPSGARPAWLSEKYPEVLRVNSARQKNHHGERHNHCYTSSVYREKIQIMNRKLAERYAKHPAVLLWHISNEFGGDCHCELCQEAFRNWLKDKYETLDNLNHAWWTEFWSHRYTSWSQIESPGPLGDSSLHGLNLDWKRFVTYQTTDFMKHEMKPLREINPEVPITTNLMEYFDGLNYWEVAKELDVVSWDNYPQWHGSQSDADLAMYISMYHDVMRSLKGGKPFMLMESTPSLTNWQGISKLKKPGMHLLSSLQAVAHGSDTVQYFQWRKSRGASEKFHGAVVDHCGHENTRVFRDVTDVGNALSKMDEIVGTTVPADTAIIFDWENRWAVNDGRGPRNIGVKYEETVVNHYKTFWKKGVPVDVINMDQDFSKYKILVAPMLYMVRPGVAERIEKFVNDGGTFVATYWSGIVNETDLCFLGGFPGPLRKVLGIWSEEIDSLYDNERNSVTFKENELSVNGTFEAFELCDLIHEETAKAIAYYDKDFYAGRPAVTVNNFGTGKAYYLAARTKDDFFDAFYGKLIEETKVKKALDTELPLGVTAQVRTDGEKNYIFLMNFNNAEAVVNIGEGKFIDFLSKESLKERISLTPFGIVIIEETR